MTDVFCCMDNENKQKIRSAEVLALKAFNYCHNWHD